MTWVTVDLDLNELDDADILSEYQRRKFDLQPKVEWLTQINEIYHLRRNGKDYQQELDNLIYDTIGRM